MAIALFSYSFFEDWIDLSWWKSSIKKNKVKRNDYISLQQSIFWLFCYLSNNLERCLNPVLCQTQFSTHYKTDRLFHTWILLIVWHFTNVHIPKPKSRRWNGKEMEKKIIARCQLIQLVRVYMIDWFFSWNTQVLRDTTNTNPHN